VRRPGKLPKDTVEKSVSIHPNLGEKEPDNSDFRSSTRCSGIMSATLLVLFVLACSGSFNDNVQVAPGSSNDNVMTTEQSGRLLKCDDSARSAVSGLRGELLSTVDGVRLFTPEGFGRWQPGEIEFYGATEEIALSLARSEQTYETLTVVIYGWKFDRTKCELPIDVYYVTQFYLIRD
jgi:hypothetical protein